MFENKNKKIVVWCILYNSNKHIFLRREKIMLGKGAFYELSLYILIDFCRNGEFDI